MGGPDRERDVSLDSGNQVALALESDERFTVIRRIIDAPGVEELRVLLEEDAADVVFPVLHGPWGEGGPLQCMLETIGIPFVGSSSTAARRAMDKLATKAVAAECGIPTPLAHEIGPTGLVEVPPPLVIKPAEEGSSFGVRICRSPAESSRAIAELQQEHPRLMCEAFVHGRELTVGVLNEEALPIIEITPGDGFYDYQAKYHRDDTEYVVNPPLDSKLAAQIQAWSLEITRALGVSDLARVDWLLDDSAPWFLEVNTIPGMTSHSLLPMAAAENGLDMAALCSRTVLGALRRTTTSR